MMRIVRQAWWSVVKSGACATMLFAVACGGSETPQTQRGTDSQAQAPVQVPVKVTEKPFASGGKIEMQLDGGSYTVRPAGGDSIRVTLGGNVGSAKVDVATENTHAKVLVKETPRNNFEATIEVPEIADLVVRLAAGNLTLEAIRGNKDVESNAGNVNIVTGDSKDYASVEASVQAGDINAEGFGESQAGLFRRMTWSGPGKYTLRAKLIAGNLTLRNK